MKRSRVWPRLFAVLAVALMGLPAAPALADEEACTHRAYINLGGFAPALGGLPPYFYYVEEGAATGFKIEGFDPCVAHSFSMSADYDTPPGFPNAATAGSDYTRVSGTASFNVVADDEDHFGQTKTYSFGSLGDSVLEAAAEQVDVTLSNPQNAFIQPPNAAPLYIVDDDGSARVRFVEPARTETEFAKTLKIPVLLAGPSATAPVNFSVSPASSSDLEPSSGSVAWASGGRLGTVNLQMKNDTVCESPETYTISLSGVGTEAPSIFSLTINDNDCSSTTQRTLTVSKAGTGSGTVTSSPAGISCGADCSESYANNTSVTLTATPAAGSTFAGWSGACTGTATTCNLTMNANKSVTATFNANTVTNYTLTVSKSGSGSGTVTSSPAGISCGSDCSEAYADGTSVTLTANPAAGSTFGGWTGGGCSGTSTTCTVTMNQNRSVTATFNPSTTTTYTLSVNTTGSGSGSVSSDPAGISCGSDCSEAYPAGTGVTLTARPGKGVTFGGWSGDCSGTSTTCVVTMDAAKNVTATFGGTTAHTLTVGRAGTGAGTITSSPAGINCGSDCSEAYAEGTNVTLMATPAAGSIFTGWSGACAGTSTTCTVTMNQNRSATATFSLTSSSTHVLTVARDGTGSGSVSSSPAGIDCGSDCSEVYADGTSVTLTAKPGKGVAFGGWSGDCSGTELSCTVSMTQARSVTATFGSSSGGGGGDSTLTVTRWGSGSVTSSPAGISCGSDCSEAYPSGTSVTLTATAGKGATFAGWGGACSGTATTCVVTVNGTTSVTANFQGA